MRSTLALIALFAAATTVAAADSLTSDQVGRFASALEELAAKSEQYDELSEAKRKELGEEMPDEFREVIESHGFTEESWQRVGQRVSSALAALEFERQDVDEEIRKAREQIENNPDLSTEKKEQMVNMLEQQEKAVADHDVSSADKAAVKAHRDRLMEITGGE